VQFNAFSALTLLVGYQEEHPACIKYWVMRCWRGYLSAVMSKWLAYSPADATVTLSFFRFIEIQNGMLSGGASLSRLTRKRGH